MELLRIDHINQQFLSYQDMRSVKKFFTEMGLSLIKIGKNYSVVKEDWEAFVSGLVESNDSVNSGRKTNKFQPVLNDHEKEIYERLQKKVSQL